MSSPNLTLDPGGYFQRVPVLAATKILAGGLVCIVTASKLATNPETALNATAKVIGRAEEEVDNTAGASGALTVLVRTGVFHVPPKAAAVAPAPGGKVYADTSGTVSPTAADGPPAGIFRGVTTAGEWSVDTQLAPVI